MVCVNQQKKVMAKGSEYLSHLILTNIKERRLQSPSLGRAPDQCSAYCAATAGMLRA
jgi:hypothetical protein